jgi:trans-aconitate methyltransferase
MPIAYNQPAGDLLFGIPLSARTVLDIGCGPGDLGAKFKQLSPNCRYFGIEENADEAAHAASALDGVLTAEAETADYGFGAPEGYDCIVCHTALPHMRDPFAAIRRMAEHLAPGGCISLCVPNVEHWSFLERLLRGNWH